VWVLAENHATLSADATPNESVVASGTVITPPESKEQFNGTIWKSATVTYTFGPATVVRVEGANQSEYVYSYVKPTLTMTINNVGEDYTITGKIFKVNGIPFTKQ
jgi:hypothetical protein